MTAPLGASFAAALRERARNRPRRIVFAEGEDPRTLDAAADLAAGAVVHPVLLGDPDAIAAGLRSRGADPGSVDMPGPLDDRGRTGLAERLVELREGRGMTLESALAWIRSPVVRAALMVRAGEVDGSVAGAVHATAEVLRAAIACVGPAPGIRTVSSAFYMGVGAFREEGADVLTFTDAGVVPDPDPDQLAEIALAASRARRRIVGDEPVVAFLSYSTRGSAEGVSVDRMRQALDRFRQMAPDVPADGELQADAAIVPEVAARKCPGSAVAGRANVLVFPDLAAGNISYKLVQRLAGAMALGPILQGLARPCNDLSRGAEAADVANVACITSLMAD